MRPSAAVTIPRILRFRTGSDPGGFFSSLFEGSAFSEMASVFFFLSSLIQLNPSSNPSSNAAEHIAPNAFDDETYELRQPIPAKNVENHGQARNRGPMDDSSTENRVYLFRELAAAYIAAKPDVLGDDGKSALAEIARISCIVADGDDSSPEELAEQIRKG